MAGARFVPQKWIIIRDPSGYTQRKLQPAHWALPSGQWVTRPGAAAAVSSGASSSGSSTTTSPGGYTPAKPGDIEAQAHAYAQAQIAAKAAAIKAQQEAAAKKARIEEATLGELGTAQMGMINQIPANVQGIRNTAGQAISQFGNAVAGQAAQGLQGDQASAAAFAATQGAPETPGATPGLDSQAAMAASAEMGGRIPATLQAETGANEAGYAAGMPAVVARATQDQVAMRMAQAATEDAGFRQQLIDNAATEGGIYQDALSNLWDVETKKFGIYQAQQQIEIDKQNMILKYQAELASEVAARQKTKAQAAKDLRDYKLAVQRVGIAQQNADTSAGRAATSAAQSAANYYTDGKWGLTPKGYKHTAQGVLVKIATPKAKTKKGGVIKANQMAAQFRGTPLENDPNKKGNKRKTTPKVAYASGVAQIRDALVGMGYPYAEADAIAHNAMNAHYGPEFRPKKKKK